jgi:hypothetical protein
MLENRQTHIPTSLCKITGTFFFDFDLNFYNFKNLNKTPRTMIREKSF